MEEENIKEINPVDYFNNVKSKIETMNDEKLTLLYNNALHLVEKYNRTGQKKAARKLMFHIQSIIKEKKIFDLGINKFVYKDDIEEYIQEVASNQVVIKDIKNYERDIPDEIVEILEKVKPYFDEFYIVYTDYTGKESKKVQKERREKDPILFGAFMNRDKAVQSERFYYIGDWVDEYCDLTLDKLVAEMKEYNGENILNNVIPIPETKEELQAQLNNLHIEEDCSVDGAIKLTLLSEGSVPKKKSFIDKIRTFLTRND